MLRLIRIVALLLFFSLALSHAAKAANFQSSIRTTLQNCVQDAIDQNAFSKTEKAGQFYLILDCHQQAAIALWTQLGQLGIQSQAIKMTDNSIGEGRFFGNSFCAHKTTEADGSPANSFDCRIALDIGDDVLQAF